MNTAETLLALWKDIHTSTPTVDYFSGRPHHRPHGIYTETRPLTEEEWKTVREAIQLGCPATIFSHGYGFTFSLGVYEPTTPLFPGVPVEPRLLILIAANQYPGNAPNKNRDDQGLSCSADGKSGGVFEVFEKICNTPENLDRLRAEGIEPPQNRSRYQY
jgi:hypothetical protein